MGGELLEADEVVAAPAFPHQFEQAFGEQVVERGFALFDKRTFANLVHLGLSALAVAHLGFGKHQEHVGIAEEDDVVVLQRAVVVGRVVGFVLRHACPAIAFERRTRQVLGHFERMIDEGIAVAVIDLPVVDIHRVAEEIVVVAGVHLRVVAVLRVVVKDAVGVHRADGGAGSVLRSPSEGLAMGAVEASENVVEVVVVERVVHRDDEDVLVRRLVVDGEVVTIVLLEVIIQAHVGDGFAIVLGGLPGIQDLTIDIEQDFPAVGTFLVGPLVVAIDLGIQRQLGQQEVGDGACEASVVVAQPVAALVCQVGCHLLQLVEDEAIDGAALALHDVFERFVVVGHQRDVAEHVHRIEVEHGTQAAHFGGEGFVLLVGQHQAEAIAVDEVERTVAARNDLVEVLPRAAQLAVRSGPLVVVEPVPEAAIVPVGSAHGHHLLVGGDGVPVIDAAYRPLQAVAGRAATYIIIEVAYQVAFDFCSRRVGFVFFNLSLGIFFEAGAERQSYPQGSEQ